MAPILPVPNPIPSYWLSQPSPLHNLRTAASLPQTCDIAIIGSGLAGILTAYHILQTHTTSSSPAPNILLLEARALCSGATARNGGHSKIKTSTLLSLDPSTADEMYALVRANRETLKRIAEREDVDCELEVRRSFDVFLDADEAAHIKSAYLAQRSQDRVWTREYSLVPPQHVEHVTSIKGAKLAFSVPVVSLWPYKFAAGLLEKMVKTWDARRLNVQTDTPVTGVSSSSSSSQGKGASTILETPRGNVEARKVVFATNAYTAGLLPQFAGVITPVKGMASHIVAAAPVHPHLNNTYNITFDPERGTDYLNPRPDGSIVVGGGGFLFKDDRALWHGNYDDSTRFPVSTMAHWEGYMGRTFLGWEGDVRKVKEKVESAWVGIMGRTPDGKPHIGRVPGTSNQWMLAGFNGGGNGLIGVCAQAVADMVTKDLGFGDVAAGFGVPESFGSSEERIRR